MNIQEIAQVMTKQIMAQREEILRAFIAKYGCDPDEIMQVEEETERGLVWYVTLRKNLKGMKKK